jgi:hypothetical protein
LEIHQRAWTLAVSLLACRLSLQLKEHDMLKAVSSITNAIGALNYKGTWNASTNTPPLASGVGVKGDYYVVSVAGSTALDGISNWGIGDWVTFNGTAWQRVEGGADSNPVNLTVTGNTTLGDATADTISANGRFNTDLVPSTTNTRDLGTSALRWKEMHATTFTEAGFGVVSQTDIGTAANEIPLNQYLGGLAYVDTETPALDVGTGITTGTGTVCVANGGSSGGLYRVSVLIDLRGLNSGGTAGDIIGVDGTALFCYIARLPTMTVLGGRMTCLETPAGGDTDLDLYSAVEGTGVEDQAITALTETEIIDAGAQTVGTVTFFGANPAANEYLYLVGQSTSDATYTAGRFLIEIFGV